MQEWITKKQKHEKKNMKNMKNMKAKFSKAMIMKNFMIPRKRKLKKILNIIKKSKMTDWRSRRSKTALRQYARGVYDKPKDNSEEKICSGEKAKSIKIMILQGCRRKKESPTKMIKI